MNPTVVGALIGFGGTFAAATTTQVLLSRRQQSDLRIRIEADQALRDLDEGRKVIDAALVRASDLNDLLRAVFRTADALDIFAQIDGDDDSERLRSRGGEHGGKRLSDVVQQFHEAGNAALHAAQQLEVRFGVSVLTALYKETITEFILSAVQVDRSTGAINRERAGQHASTAGFAREAFVVEAYRIVGLTLASTDTPDSELDPTG